jgi:hypothetical protein
MPAGFSGLYSQNYQSKKNATFQTFKTAKNKEGNSFKIGPAGASR